MYKKILCVSMLALGLNAAALADDFGGGDGIRVGQFVEQSEIFGGRRCGWRREY